MENLHHLWKKSLGLSVVSSNFCSYSQTNTSLLLHICLAFFIIVEMIEYSLFHLICLKIIYIVSLLFWDRVQYFLLWGRFILLIFISTVRHLVSSTPPPFFLFSLSSSSLLFPDFSLAGSCCVVQVGLELAMIILFCYLSAITSGMCPYVMF